MPPPSIDPSLDLIVLANALSLFQLPVSSSIPSSLLDSLVAPPPDGDGVRFLSITRTHHELSIVTDELQQDVLESCRLHGGIGLDVQWRAIRVKGPMILTLTGIMNALTLPLRDAAVPVFTLSTWNTDYVLVTDENLDTAVAALKSDGWRFDDGYTSA